MKLLTLFLIAGGLTFSQTINVDTLHICPICHKHGEKSQIILGQCSETLISPPPDYYDENGHLVHSPDPNTVSCEARCSRGHKLSLVNDKLTFVPPQPNVFEYQDIQAGTCFAWTNDEDGYKGHPCAKGENVITWDARSKGIGKSVSHCVFRSGPPLVVEPW